MNYEQAMDKSTLVDYSTAVIEIKKHNVSDDREITQILRECCVRGRNHADTEVYSTERILIELGY